MDEVFLTYCNYYRHKSANMYIVQLIKILREIHFGLCLQLKIHQSGFTGLLAYLPRETGLGFHTQLFHALCLL